MQAGPTWNLYAAQHSFDAYPVQTTDTFADAYNGSNFALDFDAMKRAVARALGTDLPDIDGNDLMNVSLDNWPA